MFIVVSVAVVSDVFRSKLHFAETTLEFLYFDLTLRSDK